VGAWAFHGGGASFRVQVFTAGGAMTSLFLGSRATGKVVGRLGCGLHSRPMVAALAYGSRARVRLLCGLGGLNRASVWWGFLGESHAWPLASADSDGAHRVLFVIGSIIVEQLLWSHALFYVAI
jgi:hypothetical protein